MTELTWQEVWHQGVVPQLSDDELCALEAALRGDDARLIQGSTVIPDATAALAACLDQDQYRALPPTCACLIALPLWQGRGLTTLGQVEDAFCALVLGANERLGCCAFTRLTYFWDITPREQARVALLAEVAKALAARGAP